MSFLFHSLAVEEIQLSFRSVNLPEGVLGVSVVCVCQ